MDALAGRVRTHDARGALKVFGLGLAACCLAASASAQVVFIQLGTAAGPPGSTVSVPISMSGSAGRVSGLQLDMLFDTAALSAASPECTAASGVPLSWSFPSQPPPPAGKTRLRLLVFDASSAMTLGDGPLATCQFQINSGAALGGYALQGNGLLVSDIAGGTLNSSVSDGSVQVQNCSGCGCS